VAFEQCLRNESANHYIVRRLLLKLLFEILWVENLRRKKGRCPDTSFRIDIFCVSKLFAYKTCQKEFSHQIQTKAFKKETRGKEVLPSKIKFTVTYCGFFYPLLCFLIYTPSFLANQCLLSGLLECRIHLHCRYITLHF
jgi:hypothetical protein